MSEIVRFETNVPVSLALRYDEGRAVEGKYGDQVMFSVDGGGIFYVDPPVAQRIKDMGIKRFEPFTICKTEVRRGNRRFPEWVIEKGAPVTGLPAVAAAPAAAVSAEPSVLEEQLRQSLLIRQGRGVAAVAAAALPAVTPRPALETPAADTQGVQSVAQHSKNLSTAADPKHKTLLQLSLMQAIEAARGAEEYAKGVDYAVRFTSEDIRAMALSLYIQGAKEGGRTWTQ